MRPRLSVTVLGCSGSYAGPGEACTGFLVRSPGATVWHDAGPGTFANLQRYVHLAELDAIVLSHEHPDHWLELPVVHSALRYYEPRPLLPVITTAGTRALAEPLCRDSESVFDWSIVTGGDAATIGDQHWRWSITEHYVETLASRVEVGSASVVFSSDTGPGWDIGELGSDTDLAVLDSTFLAQHEDLGVLHMSARQAAEKAVAAGARRLVLTHLAPGQQVDAHAREAGASFGGPVEVARTGSHYEM